jgi:hypothetical protein
MPYLVAGRPKIRFARAVLEIGFGKLSPNG